MPATHRRRRPEEIGWPGAAFDCHLRPAFWPALVLWVTLLCGCSPGAVPDQDALDAQLRGLTLGKAVQQLGLKPEDCQLFDEPPGVARGIEARLPDGRTVQLWLDRQDGLFRENRDWTFQQIAERKVEAVKVRETKASRN